MNAENHRVTAEQITGWDHAQAGLSIVLRPDRTIVKVSGDIDIATAPAVREGLYSTCGRCAGLMVVDLSAVSSCDAFGAAVLIGAQRRATLRGIPLDLTAPSPAMAERLRLTGLDRILTRRRSTDQARN